MAQTKREKAIKAAVVPGKAYAFEDAINILKTATKAKFVESIDVAVRLGVDAKKSDQQVRGSTVLLYRYRQVGPRRRVRSYRCQG